MAIVQKIDSNTTGLRFAKEESLGVLPSSGVTWYPLEPNSYDSFGGQISTVARNPINAGRQRQKGVTVDLDASGGFNSDWTQQNLQDILQSFFFADFRRKGETQFEQVPVINVDGTTEEYDLSNLQLDSIAVNVGGAGYALGDIVTVDNGTFTTQATAEVTGEAAGVVTALQIVEPGRYSVAPATVAETTTGGSGAGLTVDTSTAAVVQFVAGQLIEATDFNLTPNNGLKLVTAVTGDITITVAEDLVDEASPPADAGLVVVGVQASTGDIDVDATLPLPALTSTVLDFTTLGLVPGEPIFIGGDAAANQFVNAANNGVARVKTIAANRLELDKTQQTMVTETGTGLDIRLFFGRVIKNEADPTLQKRQTLQLERTLGAPDDAQPSQIQAEYLVGAVANQITWNFSTADKINADLTFVATDNEQRPSTTGVKPGARPPIVSDDAYNTSNDFSRLKLSILDPVDSNPTPLFAFVTEFTLVLNNNATPNKAISVLGAFEVTVGQFNVEGTTTAYFSQVEAVQAVRDNADVTLDFFLVKANAGIFVDVPLIALGDGRLNVEQDAPITLPLETPAAADRNFNHTLLMAFFDYLPDLADPN